MKKAILAIVAAGAAGYGVYQLGCDDAAAPPREVSVVDRLWIDHIPRNDRDVIQAFVAITDDSFGVFQATSQWKGEFEAFRYEKHGGELDLLFPQTGTRDRVRAKATECDRAGMDYCLELDGASRGVKRYYSREGWEIGSVREIDPLIRGLAR